MSRTLLTLASLVLLLGVVAAGCGDDSGSDDGDGTTATVTVTDSSSPSNTTAVGKETTVGETTDEDTTDQDGAPPPADIEVTELTGFQSPSGNIGCYIDAKNVRCDIADRQWSPPKAPASCNLDYGQGITMNAGGAPEFVCAGDTALGGGDELPYGESIAAGNLRCDSAESGMTCTDIESGRSFTLSQESYSLD